MSVPVRIITITADELRSLIREEVEAAVQRAAPAPEPPPPVELYISLTEAHRRTGYHPDTLREWIHEGILPGTRRGPRGHWRVRPSDLEAAIRRAQAPTRVDPEAIAGEILRRRR